MLLNPLCIKERLLPNYIYMTQYKIRRPSSGHFFQKMKFEYMTSYTYLLM